jgi:YegS/Rv2252/BmrU family lipid kinase
MAYVVVARLLLITNSAAGGAEQAAVEAGVGVLRRRADVEVAVTSSAEECAKVLATRNGRRVVVCGGDGSVHTVVGALRAAGDLAEPLGLIPLGTGNDLARALGIPLDPTEAAGIVLDGQPRPLDLLVDDAGEVVVNVVHVGIGAEAVRAGQAVKSWFGRFAYALGGVVAGSRERGWRLRVEVDGRTVAEPERPLLQVGIGLGRTVGGGTPLVPQADPDDGLADVVVSAATGPVARMSYALRLRRGEHIDRPDVRSTRGRTVTVAGEDFPYNADGEVRGPVPRRVWRVEPAGWRLTVPQRPG